ncbi:hypothetical protein GH714_032664 [Hevea brasiliensis]|uniref:Uncharacterized protein n=1 Tax=Hevea brasiliensis TaxID=3981 RepID=A0A6A6N6R1_HEVBR|nr:hypothetical protein GH714_032664 [Hevea brasiliensis]
MFALFSLLYKNAPLTSWYGFSGVEASEMYFAAHDSGMGTFALGVGLFGHYESGSMQNEPGPSSSMQQMRPELQLLSTQNLKIKENIVDMRDGPVQYVMQDRGGRVSIHLKELSGFGMTSSRKNVKASSSLVSTPSCPRIRDNKWKYRKGTVSIRILTFSISHI